MKNIILFGGDTNRNKKQKRSGHKRKHLPPLLSAFFVPLVLALASFSTFFAGGCPEPSPSNYTVTFNTDAGSSVDNQTVASGGKATKPSTNPTKVGFTFVDWYKDEAKTIVFDFNTTITASMTLYAKWNQNAANQFTVTFNVDGGSTISRPNYYKWGESNQTKYEPNESGFHLC